MAVSSEDSFVPDYRKVSSVSTQGASAVNEEGSGVS
jgi:hypothetical protein